jgi:YHS domain-containing protein
VRYEPEFGGYCAYAASIDKISPIDPEFWEVVDGRLLLQHNQKAWDLWHEDPAGNLVKADANWPGLVGRHGKPARILVNVDDQGVAVQGYDVVAYFAEGRPVAGLAEHESVYGGAKYHFASKANRDQFERDPTRFEPQFGGYCAYAASIRKVSPIDPQFWQIVDGRLLLQHTQKAYDLFNQDTAGNLVKADQNWPGLIEKHGR